MPLSIIVYVSKKLPGATDFSSIQASCSLTGEVPTGADPLGAAAALFAKAELAVDRQLGQAPATTPAPHSTNLARSPADVERPHLSARVTSNITDSQKRLIRRIGREDIVHARLSQLGVGDLDQLSIRQASQLIDAMKANP